MLLPRSRDPLTGLPVRQSFLLGLEQAVAQAHGRAQTLCTLAIHVGPPPAAPQRCPDSTTVAKVGKLLRFANGRRGELARLDTLLFALLLRDRDLGSAHVLGEQLLEAIALHYRSDALLDCSIGAACSPAHAHWSGRELLELAMWRCVRAAHAGLRQVCSSGLDRSHAAAGWPSFEPFVCA